MNDTLEYTIAHCNACWTLEKMVSIAGICMRVGLRRCERRCAYPHVHEAQHFSTHMRIHLEQLIEFALRSAHAPSGL